MKQSIEIPVPNAIILILDFDYGTLPDALAHGLITATSSSIVVGTAPDVDGTVEILLMNIDPVDQRHLARVYDSTIDTPNRDISVCTVYNERVLATQVKNVKTAVQVWVNDEIAPTKVVIVVPEAQ